MSHRQRDGFDEGAHLAKAARSSYVSREFRERIGAHTQPPPLRETHTHVWRWWVSLSSRRPPSMHGIGMASWSDVDAWARRMKAEPSAHEWRLLAAIDSAFIAARSSPDATPPPA